MFLAFASSIAFAAEVEIRLVPFDRPDVTVDKLEKSQPLTNPVSTPQGMVMKTVGVEVVTWARNVLLDGKPVFERYHEGKYIDRLPVARPDLKAGEHVIWPGNHAFTVAADGLVTTKSSELTVAGNVVKVRCYPVTVRAFRANPDEGDLPLSMRISALPNLTFREASDAAKGDKALELLPVFEKFSPLTLWMPANSVDKGYLIHPLGLTFHVGADGIKASDEQASAPGLRIEKNLIDVPLYGYRIQGEVESGNKLIVPGVEQFSWTRGHPARQLTNWYPRSEPYVLQLTETGPTLSVEGDLRKMPLKAMAIDYSDRIAGGQRLLLVESESRHLTAGKNLLLRIRAVDTRLASAAETALKPYDAQMLKLARDLAAAIKSKSDADNALKANKATIENKTKALEKPKLRADQKKSLEIDLAALKARTADLEKAVETATAEIEPLNKKSDELKPIVEEFKAKLQAVADTNPLAEAPAFAQIRSYDGGEWKDLSLSAQAHAREFSLAVSDVPTGVYRLKVGVKDDTTGRPIFVESWVSIARSAPYSLGLFTNRGRDSFYRGEGFWIAAGLLAGTNPVAAGTKLSLDLIDSNGKRLPIFQQTLDKPIEQRHTVIIRMEPQTCLSLAAGHYQAVAKAGDVESRPLSLDIVEPQPRTHFTNILSMKYQSLGLDYSRVIETGEGAEQFAQWIADLGYNAIMGLHYTLDRVNRHDADIEQLVRERPELGPWESYYQPAGRDKLMSALLRRNIRFYDDIFTYNDTEVQREPRMLASCGRFISLETASMRFSPIFKGVCLYDEFYNSSDNGNVAMQDINNAAQELTYRAKYARQGYTSSRALKSLDRFVGRPFGQRDYKDLAVFRTWPAHEDSGWRTFSEQMTAHVKRIMPDSTNFTQQRFWGANGGNLAACGTPEDVFSSLDIAACVMYKDGGVGDRPVFSAMQPNVLRIRDGLPVWTQLHDMGSPGIYGMHLVRQGFFGLSQKVDGITFFDIVHDVHNPSPTDHRQTVKNLIGQVTEPYGDFLLSLDRGYAQVGIYFSRQAEYLAARKPNLLANSCEGLWVACMRAGFPARFITDRQLLNHEGDKYKVIFVPGIVYEDETPPETLKELARLVDAGKTLIVEKSSKLPLERIVHADSEFDEYDDKLGGAFPRYEDHEFDAVVEGSEETTKLLRRLLPKYVQPATQSTMLFSPDWLKKGEGQYLVMANFAPTKFTGLYKTVYQAPDMPAIRFPKRPAGGVYDVLEMKSASVKTDGDWMTLNADLRDYPGKIYAFLPAAIDKVALRCNTRVAAGKNLDYAISVLDAKGQAIDASFPIELTLLNPAGSTVLHVNRSAAPTLAGAYRVAANATTGTWKLRARELISGAVSEAAIVVESGQNVTTSEDSRSAWVRDAGQIRSFLADHNPTLIVVDQEQAWVLPQAQRLAEALTKAGKPTKVARVDEVVRLPVNWNRAAPTLDGSRLWRGDLVQPGLLVDAPVILLGKRLESRMIEGIVRRDVLAESVSGNFPGPGRAVVAWAPLAFSTAFDTVLVLAQDEAALAHGVDQLLAIDRATEIPLRQVASAAIDPNAALETGKALARAPSSARRAMSMLDDVMTLDVDPGSGNVLAGTFGYGDNLFCFDKKGRMLWKQFLPEHNVYYARFYDGGKKILAATGRGPWIFMLDAANGKVVRKFVASEWPDGHGYDGFWEGQGNTQLQIEINAKLKQIIIGGRTGLLAVDFDGKKLWFGDRAEAISAYPPAAEQNIAASFGRSLEVGSFVVSPDGARIAHGESNIVGSTPGKTPGTVVDLWAYRPMILDARTGKVLAMNEDDPGSKREWSISWPASSPDPLVHFQGVSMPMHADGKLGKPVSDAGGLLLRDGGAVKLEVSSTSGLDSKGKMLWSVSDERLFPAVLSALSPDTRRLFRCDVEGLVRCIDTSNGKTLWEHKLSCNGYVFPLEDGGVVVGTTNGVVASLDSEGKQVWAASLLDLHERPAGDYPEYVQTAVRRDVDNTGELYPISHDAAGDYDKIFRMGIEQLANGSFESAEGWSSADGPVKLESPGKKGNKSLVLATGQLVTQRLKQRIIPQGTYLLEFWYQVPDEHAKVIAGAMLTGEADKQVLTASKFTGRPGQWTFGRLAVKALHDTKTIDVGFQGEGGIVRVDLASLRPIRFPSANLLANSELQVIEPTFVRDLRIQYDRIPSAVRERLMSKNHVAAYRQGPSNTAIILTQEQAFLHNGRLDDVGPFWSEPPDPMGFSVVLAKPAWVSHVVLYLNNTTPDNVYRFISILANNLETKTPSQVALVRGNDRRFVVVYFDKPIFTDSIKILPGFHGGHQECLTEVELYGPLGGPDVASARFPADAQGYPMYMGNPAHVPTTLPADLSGEYALHFADRAVAAYACGPTVSAGIFTWGNASGAVDSMNLDPPAEPTKNKGPKRGPARPVKGPTWTLASVSPITTPARYGGCLLVGSADYQLHAISDQGTYLWGFKTGGRVYSSPLPNGDDVYFGSDDGRIYKVDLRSGMLLWEFVTGDRVRSSPAMANGKIYCASWDGFLYAIDAESGQLAWKSSLAKYTRASPAVAQGRVYLGDESGQMLCFDATSGSLLWKKKLGGYISGCPVVTEEGAVYLSEQGNIALVSQDGKVKWKRTLEARVKGQAFATQSQILIPTSEGLSILNRGDGKEDAGVSGFKPGQVIGAVVYDGKVCLVRASITTNFTLPPRTYATYESMAEVWAPKGDKP